MKKISKSQKYRLVVIKKSNLIKLIIIKHNKKFSFQNVRRPTKTVCSSQKQF